MTKKIIFLLFILQLSCNKKHENIILNTQTTSSKDYKNFESKMLIDNNPETYWNSGSTGQHWVNLKFKDETSISKVIFKVGAIPSCQFEYDILVNKNNIYKNIHNGKKYINNNDKIEVQLEEDDISDMRIVLKSDSTWVNIMDVEIWN